MLSFAVYPCFFKSSPGILGRQRFTIDCSVISGHILSFLRALLLHISIILKLSAPRVWRSVSSLSVFCPWIVTVTTLNFNQFDKPGFVCVFLFFHLIWASFRRARSCQCVHLAATSFAPSCLVFVDMIVTVHLLLPQMFLD